MNRHATVVVGAFEADAWAGLVVAAGSGVGGALRLSVETDGHRIDSADLFHLVHEVGPCAPDGGYARVAFDLSGPPPVSDDAPLRPAGEREASLVWEWARRSGAQILCRLRAGRAMRVGLEARGPWDWGGEWDVRGRTLSGRVGPAGGVHQLTFDVIAEVPVVAREVWPDGRGAKLTLDLTAGDEAFVVATLGRNLPDGHGPTPDAIRRALGEAEERYETDRVRVDGAWNGLAASVANNVHWMVLLQPESRRRYVPAGRRWLFPTRDGSRDHWTVFEWDGFFNALLLSLEALDLAEDMLDALFATQYPSGLLPNWRSRLAGTPDRSQPPIGAFVVLKIALRSGRPAILERALPVLDAWHAWWHAPVRGGRRWRASGLYAWGSDIDQLPEWVPPWEHTSTHHQKAAWESGQDDLPNWDEARWDEARWTLAMDCVDLSAFMALDAECLAILHEMRGDARRAADYRSEHQHLCALIDGHLWDEARGLYADRFDDGRFSPRVAASNFLPLLAGAGSAERRARALAVLRDPSRFWGEWIVPTISRDDPAFVDQQYWRGTIWPPTNYLLYEALRRVGDEAMAAALAERSVALFLGDWRRHQVCRENFSSVDGSGGGQRHQSWGPLFSWIGLAEFADATPWDGLRVGSTHATSASTVRRLRLCGRTWDVTLAPDGLRVACDGEPWMESDGPVCLRHVDQVDGRWRAELTATRETRLQLAGGDERSVPSGTTRIDWGG